MAVKITALLLCIVLIVAAVFIFYTHGATGQSSQTPKPTPQIQVVDKVVGIGAQVTDQNDHLVIEMTYTGSLENGTVFDSQYASMPDHTNVSSPPLIPGLLQGIIGMKAGGTRVITVPPELAYGSEGTGAVPPNATVIYEVTLNRVGDTDEGLLPPQPAAQ